MTATNSSEMAIGRRGPATASSGASPPVPVSEGRPSRNAGITGYLRPAPFRRRHLGRLICAQRKIVAQGDAVHHCVGLGPAIDRCDMSQEAIVPDDDVVQVPPHLPDEPIGFGEVEDRLEYLG